MRSKQESIEERDKVVERSRQFLRFNYLTAAEGCEANWWFQSIVLVWSYRSVCPHGLNTPTVIVFNGRRADKTFVRVILPVLCAKGLEAACQCARFGLRATDDLLCFFGNDDVDFAFHGFESESFK